MISRDVDPGSVVKDWSMNGTDESAMGVVELAFNSFDILAGRILPS